MFGSSVAQIEASGVKIGPPRPEMRALGPILGHLGSRFMPLASR